MEEKKKFTDKLTYDILHFFYSKERKIERYVIALTLIGFILRSIAALNLGVLADDMVHVSQSAGIIASKILSTHSNPALFYYLNDLAFKIFGYTTFASRFFALISGTLLIPLIYLITRELFGDKKIALLAAFFTTFSSFLIRNTFGEASLLVLFLSMFGVYLGILFLKTRKNIFIIFSGISFGLGVLTKYNAPFFLAGFLIYAALHLKLKKEKIFTRRNVKSLLILLFIIFIFALPPLVFNYLIYKNLGILDVYFSRVVQTEATQQLYGSLAGQGNSFVDGLLNFDNYGNRKLPFKTDPILTTFALFGILLMVKNKKYYPFLLLLPVFLIPFIMQSAGAPLPKHFVFMSLLLSIPAGYALSRIIKKINNKKIALALIILVMALSIISFGDSNSTPINYLDKSAPSQLKSYLNENVPEDGLIVFDSRIYTSQTYWMATPNKFLLDQQFVSLTNFANTLPSEYLKGVPIFFVECASDDCGWGTIANQPELNATIEHFFNQIKEIANLQIEISTPIYEGNELYTKSGEKVEYKVYTQTISSNPESIATLSSRNSFYFAPYLYEDLSTYVYNYEATPGPDKLMDKLAYFIILFAMILTIFSFILILYFIIKT